MIILGIDNDDNDDNDDDDDDGCSFSVLFLLLVDVGIFLTILVCNMNVPQYKVHGLFTASTSDDRRHTTTHSTTQKRRRRR